MTKEKSSMMRVSSELLEDIRLLKEVKNIKGRVGTHNNMVHELVKAELRKTHAQTKDGYVGKGCVVRGPSGEPVVISAVSSDTVAFSNNTYLVNGGVACHEMELLANSVETYEGGLVDG